jgi:hypothetical protein
LFVTWALIKKAPSIWLSLALPSFCISK